MNTYFTYSLLQYKHSLVLGEILNIGILFYFQDSNEFEFVHSGNHRVKSIYPDFDTLSFNSYIKIILTKIKTTVELFNEEKDSKEIGKFIHSNIISNDAAGLVFTKPVIINNTKLSREIIVKEYSRLLLPGINIVNEPKIKCSERLIIKSFNGYFRGSIKEKFNQVSIKNPSINTQNFNVKFDIKWNHEIENFVKSLSFDFVESTAIENKQLTTHGYLLDLKDVIGSNKIALLVAKPKDTSLNQKYHNAIKYIKSSLPDETLSIYENETGWKKYVDNTIQIIQ